MPTVQALAEQRCSLLHITHSCSTCDSFGKYAWRSGLFPVSSEQQERSRESLYPTPHSASAAVFDSTDDAAYAAGAPSSTTTLWVAPS
jgi:hypothetical protein